MKRLIFSLLSAIALICAPISSFAQSTTQITVKTVATCGSGVTWTAGKMNFPTVDTTGVMCTNSSGGGGGGVAGLTAEATASAVAAGTNKPQSEDTVNGAARIEPMIPGTTTPIDLSLPSGVLGKNGSSIATTANGLPVDLSINGAVPSLTNPIWVANAEAADMTGTFTNGTQTTSITNSSADGYASALLSINGTYGTATGVFEASDDAGSTYYSIICTRSDGSAQETGYTSLTNVNRQWSCPVSGNDTVRIRSTAVASGTVNARVGITAPPNNSGIVGGTVTLGAGSAIVGKTSQVDSGGTDATDTTNHAVRVNVVTGAATGVAQGSTTSGQTGGLSQCATTTASPTYVTAQTNPCSSDVHAGQRTLLQDTTGTPVDFTTTAPVGPVGPYPGLNTAGVFSPATPETCASGNVANATVACTLATAVGKTTYITGFTMTADGATVGLAVSCTLTGTITGTMTYTFGYPAGVAVQSQPLNIQFSYPVPASATNTTIVVSCPASGTGGTNAAISATGFQL